MNGSESTQNGKSALERRYVVRHPHAGHGGARATAKVVAIAHQAAPR